MNRNAAFFKPFKSGRLVELTRQIIQSKGQSLNRSQYGSCSTKYDTPAGIKVVYRRFGAPTLPSE